MTSKLCTFFIDGFTSEMKSQSMAHLLRGSAHIYWIWDPWKWSALNMGFVVKRPSRTQGQCFFRFRAGRAAIFGWVQKQIRAGAKILREGCPCPDLTPPIVRRGVISFAPKYCYLSVECWRVKNQSPILCCQFVIDLLVTFPFPNIILNYLHTHHFRFNNLTLKKT